MTSSGPNLAASIHQRLLHVARQTHQEFQQLLTRFALERLLVRLAESTHRDDFILKGAMLFLTWDEEPHRPTIDLDLLGRGSPDEDQLRAVFAELCATTREDDALTFDATSVTLRRIREDAKYEGMQVHLIARLAKARITLQVDVGFGDAVVPRPSLVDFPTLLNLSPLRLKAYPKEAVVAEKLEALIVLGMANSRMKDYFDLWFLSQRFAFDGAILTAAIRATLDRRGTQIPAIEPVGLSGAFAADGLKQQQWAGFIRKGRPRNPPPPLPAVVDALRAFLSAPLEALKRGDELGLQWPSGGPWGAPAR